MRIEHIQSHLRHLLENGSQHPHDLFKSMTTLYLKERIDDTDVEAGGDTLLFRWGRCNRASGECFEIELARHVLLPSSHTKDGAQRENSAMTLRAVFSYLSSDVTSHISQGNKTCDTLEMLPEFEASVLNSECVRTVQTMRPQSVAIGIE